MRAWGWGGAQSLPSLPGLPGGQVVGVGLGVILEGADLTVLRVAIVSLPTSRDYTESLSILVPTWPPSWALCLYTLAPGHLHGWRKDVLLFTQQPTLPRLAQCTWGLQQRERDWCRETKKERQQSPFLMNNNCSFIPDATNTFYVMVKTATSFEPYDVLSVLHTPSHLILRTTLWFKTVSFPTLQMGKLRLRNLHSPKNTLGGGGRAEIQSRSVRNTSPLTSSSTPFRVLFKAF